MQPVCHCRQFQVAIHIVNASKPFQASVIVSIELYTYHILYFTDSFQFKSETNNKGQGNAAGNPESTVYMCMYV